MRMLSRNVRSGGASRAGVIADEIRRHAPDVVVLTEVRATSAALLADLARRGWRHQAVGTNRDGRGAAAVLSAAPGKSRTPAPTEAGFAGRWVEVHLTKRDLTVIGIYGPLDEEDHEAFWSTSLQGLVERVSAPQAEEWTRLRREHPDAECCIAGDFNLEAGHRLFAGTRAGRDAFRAVLAAPGQELSCITGGASNPLARRSRRARIDHILVSAGLVRADEASGLVASASVPTLAFLRRRRGGLS